MMDIGYQYETFNGLPVYYGGYSGYMYDLEDSEEDDPLEMALAAYVEDYNFDVIEGMELMVYNRCRPDGGEARIGDTVDMFPMCQTVSCVTQIGPDESSDTSGTDTAVINGSDIEDFCQWPELSDQDCFVSDVRSSVDSSLCISEQDDLGYADVASVVDFDSENLDVDFCFNSDEGSVAELKWNTWDEACTLEFQNVSVIFSPDSAVVRLAVNIKDSVYNMEEAPVLKPLEHSVLKKPLDGGSLEGRLVVDWFVRLIMEPLEHSVLATTSVWEPLEHSNCVVTDHVDIDSFWMAPWDAGGTLGDSCRQYMTSWRTVFRSVV